MLNYFLACCGWFRPRECSMLCCGGVWCCLEILGKCTRSVSSRLFELCHLDKQVVRRNCNVALTLSIHHPHRHPPLFSPCDKDHGKRLTAHSRANAGEHWAVGPQEHGQRLDGSLPATTIHSLVVVDRRPYPQISRKVTCNLDLWSQI